MLADTSREITYINKVPNNSEVISILAIEKQFHTGQKNLVLIELVKNLFVFMTSDDPQSYKDNGLFYSSQRHFYSIGVV
jgi:hypothetical protein